MIIKYLLVVLFLVGCASEEYETDNVYTVETCTVYTSAATGTTTEYCDIVVSRIEPYITDDGSINR